MVDFKQALADKPIQLDFNTKSLYDVPLSDRPTQLRGKILVRNKKEGWFAGYIQSDQYGMIDVTGATDEPPRNVELIVDGQWIEHPRFGEQFKIIRLRTARPNAVAKLLLNSGFLCGVKEVIADRIYAMYGDEVFEHMNAQDLQQVTGIGPVNVVKLLDSWEKNKRHAQSAMIGLSIGLTLLQTKQCAEIFGDDLARVVRETPYELTRADGISFKEADAIALAQGHPRNATDRMIAGAVEAMRLQTSAGHTCLPRRQVWPEVEKLLGIDTERDWWWNCLAQTQNEHDRRIDIIEEEINGQLEILVADHELHRLEIEIAEDTHRILNAVPDRKMPELTDAMLRAFTDVPLTDEQLAAIRLAFKSNLFVLTGGPGTGKTTALKVILSAFDFNGFSVITGAPTGKAAMRIKEATGYPSMTVHRLLAWKGNFTKGPDDPIDQDVTVVDEGSMLDVPLSHALLSAIKSGRRAILVGDADQLPPVGPGQVLRDLLAAGTIPSARLTQVHRQAAGSGIVVNAHHLNKGEPLELGAGRWTDCHWVDCPASSIVTRIEDLVGVDLPARGILPSQVTVLAALRKDVAALNVALQQMLNPSRTYEFGFLKIKVGDPVRHTKNDYSLNVFNGECGFVVACLSEEDIKRDREENSTWDSDPKVVTVQYPDRVVGYTRDKVRQLTLAYCLTIHASQGSQFPVVVMVVTKHFEGFMKRELPYTGITRAQKDVYLVGDRAALEIYRTAESRAFRWTRLVKLL